MSASADALIAVFGMKRVKPKKCQHCKAEFIPQRMGQKVCSVQCAQSIAKAKREKVERANDRQKREQLKTKRTWIKEVQIEFNRMVRIRDIGKLCISCGVYLNPASVGGGFDCGHYRSVGSAPHLRFDDRNAHGQCKKCNRYGSGMAVDYRIGLLRRIGSDAVEAIESDQSPKNYTIDELKAMKAQFRAEANAMEKRRDASLLDAYEQIERFEKEHG